jgi:hypothetical protein
MILKATIGIVALGLAITAPHTLQSPVWTVSLRTAGPVRFGITIDDARKLLADSLPGAGLVGCDLVKPQSAPAGLDLMVEEGRVVRVDIRDSTVPTKSGARVGDTEERIRSLYGARIRTEAHKYTNGHYLIFVPADPADSAYRLIFETDGKRVVKFRAGLRPQVEYVEGCS